MTIALKFCTIDERDGAVWTTFPDGNVSANYPPSDDGQFHALGLMCGFTDPLRYCNAHELAHATVAEVFFDRPSYVVHMAAQGRKCSIAAARSEERLVWYCQRAACGAIPVVDPQWNEVIEILKQHGLSGDAEVSSHHLDMNAS